MGALAHQTEAMSDHTPVPQEEVRSEVTIERRSDLSQVITVKGQSARLSVNGSAIRLPAGEYVVSGAMSDITPAPNEALTELFEDSADLIMAPQGAPDSWPDVAYLSMHDMEHPDEGGEWLNSPLDYVGGIQVKSYTDKATSDARIAELEARLRRG